MKWLFTAIMACMLIVPLELSQEPEFPFCFDFSMPIIVDSSDINCAAWAIFDEARGEPIEGQRAVLDVIITRMVKYDMTACQVVKQPGQFSGYNPSVGIRVTKNMLTAYAEVSRMAPVAEDAEFFHADYVHPAWKSVDRMFQIGHHIFYKTKENHK